MTKTSCVCVFARAPEPGRVKTRLSPILGAEQACRLHEQLVLHCLERTAGCNADRQLWTTDPGHTFIRQCAARHDLVIFEQHGRDLGARMAHAIETNLQYYDEVIVIGTDCPAISLEIIDEAIASIRQDSDVVIAPAEDGGYVLVGMRTALPVLFEDIDWGTSSVMQQTRKRLDKLGTSWQELDIYWDVDRPEDYRRLLRDYSSMGVSAALPQSDHEPG